ncbi:MAG: hypothetical protein R3C49_04085 [Planctomycetaceae bacterium]
MIRKEKPLTDTEVARTKLDDTARRLELAGAATGGENSSDWSKYKLYQLELRDARDHEDEQAEPKFRRAGTTGCCGRGCNGCLPFWHDPAYAKGRELMKQKKMGERLERKVQP